MSNLCNLLKRNSENKTKDNTVAKTGNVVMQNELSDSEETKLERKGKRQRLTAIHYQVNKKHLIQ